MSRMAEVLRHYGSDYVPEGYGDRWRPLRCPFHDDRHASASFNEELDAFACLACGMKGNAVTLLMMKENLSARDADRLATSIAGPDDASVRRSGGTGDGVPAGQGLRGGRRRRIPSRRSGRAAAGA